MWMGDIHSRPLENKKMWIPLASKSDVQKFHSVNQNLPPAAHKYALKLMDVFFTKEELKTGNCTVAEGRTLLNQQILQGMKCKPVEPLP